MLKFWIEIIAYRLTPLKCPAFGGANLTIWSGKGNAFYWFGVLSLCKS
jgi:hypothetical protein